jgi:hypothetical protein
VTVEKKTKPRTLHPLLEEPLPRVFFQELGETPLAIRLVPLPPGPLTRTACLNLGRSVVEYAREEDAPVVPRILHVPDGRLEGPRYHISDIELAFEKLRRPGRQTEPVPICTETF